VLVLQVPLDQLLGGGLPAILPSLKSSGCSFPYWFPFKCDAWQSSLFHSSHVGVPISFSLSPPYYDVLHPTLFLNVSVPNSVYSCFSHYSLERFHFGYIIFVLLVSSLVSFPYVMIGLLQKSYKS